eukprot:scaffold4329_cov76-Skeletonema_dohrnii-CCMP3373.AAC.3
MARACCVEPRYYAPTKYYPSSNPEVDLIEWLTLNPHIQGCSIADLSSVKGKPLKEMKSLVANAMPTRLPQRRLRYRRVCSL